MFAMRQRLTQRGLHSTRRLRAGHDAPHYNEPTGLLFGEKPLAPGEKRVKEKWENQWVWGFLIPITLIPVFAHFYKPDNSIETLALKEAKLRLEASGERYKYEPR